MACKFAWNCASLLEVAYTLFPGTSVLESLVSIDNGLEQCICLCLRKLDCMLLVNEPKLRVNEQKLGLHVTNLICSYDDSLEIPADFYISDFVFSKFRSRT